MNTDKDSAILVVTSMRNVDETAPDNGRRESIHENMGGAPPSPDESDDETALGEPKEPVAPARPQHASGNTPSSGASGQRKLNLSVPRPTDINGVEIRPDNPVLLAARRILMGDPPADLLHSGPDPPRMSGYTRESGWETRQSRSGRGTYYINVITGERSWNPPGREDKSSNTIMEKKKDHARAKGREDISPPCDE